MIEKHYDYTGYAYVYNNPLLFIDPFGLDSTSFLNGWNTTVSGYNEAFMTNFLDRMDNPSLLISDLGQLSEDMLTLLCDVLGISGLTGNENATGEAMLGTIGALSEIPNMSDEQIGSMAAIAVIIVGETLIERKAPSSLFGAKGVKTASTTVWKQKGSRARIDIENPAPGVRAGQLHYQDANDTKYMYNPSLGAFFGENAQTGNFDIKAPKSVNNLIDDPKFKSGIIKGLRYLGEY